MRYVILLIALSGAGCGGTEVIVVAPTHVRSTSTTTKAPPTTKWDNSNND